MRKQSMIAILACFFAFTMIGSGCGSTPEAQTPVTDASAEATQEAAPIASYTYIYDLQSEESDLQNITYRLDLTNETDAVYSMTSLSNDGSIYTTTYYGSYTQEKDRITFTHEDLEGNVTLEMCFFIEDGACTLALDAAADFSDCAGEYQGTTEEYGDAVLKVERDGTATITAGDYVFQGSIFWLNDRLDFIGTDVGKEITIDWYVNLYELAFTYEVYSYEGDTDYSDYAGEITAFGDLGEITFILSNDGSAKADVTIDGQVLTFDGDYYINTDDKKISGIDLYNSDIAPYNLYISGLDEIDGSANYYGSLILTLSAG